MAPARSPHSARKCQSPALERYDKDNSHDGKTKVRKRDKIKGFVTKCKKMVRTSEGKKKEESGVKTEIEPKAVSLISSSVGCVSVQDPQQLALQTPEGVDNSADEAETAQKNADERMKMRPSICRQPLARCADLGLSLSGCGFLGIYHFGVVKCFLTNGQDLDKGLNVMYSVADDINALKFGALSPGFYLGERLVQTRENRLVSKFPSREYLIQCLNASCYIPMYSMGVNAIPPTIDGEPYIDGGYTNNLPDFSDLRTITISPFSRFPSHSKRLIAGEKDAVKVHIGCASIMDIIKVNLRNIVRGAQALFPPSRETLKQYYNQGYRDAFKFLLENGMLERTPGSAV